MPRQKLTKSVPSFRNEAAERKFWEQKGAEYTAYVDWAKAQPAVFPNLKASSTSISLRLPDSLLIRIKVEANRLDVPYQSLMKIWLSEKLKEIQQS